jgi:hypothetical protein|tara:strand:- start:124 stop:285 length:162 start_codon:yes stop_codon:yes gene_type:complete
MATKAERVKNYINDKMAFLNANPCYYYTGLVPKTKGMKTTFDIHKPVNKKHGR